MAVMNLQRLLLDNLAKQLRDLLPEIVITPGESLHWSPEKQVITYKSDESDENLWGLLHEAGHARLGHSQYKTDIELLQLEVAAWHEAEQIASLLDQKIDAEHIQDCLDTYRDWLHQRSTCPRCGIVSFQETSRSYSCFNCHKNWSVSASRFCRPYRLGADTIKNRPEKVPQAVFRNGL